MNKKVTVELDWDTIDKITTCSMKSLVESLEVDLEKRRADTGIAIFEVEKELDIALIEKHIEAFKLVLKYYGENADESERV
jgi:hypothetical protein